MKKTKREQLFDWIGEICSWQKPHEYCKYEADSNPLTETRIRIYTHNHEYLIVAKEDYLGCGVKNRLARAGENWQRGHDLPDGDFSRETWEEIKDAIIQTELVKIAKLARAETISENPKAIGE